MCAFRYRCALLCGLLVLLSACAAWPEPVPPATFTPVAPVGRTIVLGDVSDEPTEIAPHFQPLADYLAARLGTHGISGGAVQLAPSLDAMGDLLQREQVDLYFDSPYPAMVINDAVGAQPILRRWKGGEAVYSSVFFTRAESPITSLADLRGQMLGLEESFSTSGYFLPVTTLIGEGLRPREKPTSNAPVGSDEVGYVFSQDADNTIQWVLSGRVAAGAVDRRSLEQLPPESRAALRTFAETEQVPRHVVLVRPGMDPALREAISAILLAMHETSEGRRVLVQFEETARFDVFPAEASLERMRLLYQRTQGS